MKKGSIVEKLNQPVTKEDIIQFFKKNALTIYIIINILYILIGSFLVKTYQIFFSEFAQGYIYLFLTNIAAIITLLLTKKYKKDIAHLFIILIGIFAIISTIFAVNQYVAIYGIADRYEGVFSILYYLTIMFLSSFIPEQNKKTVIYFILLSGAIQAIYGICQVYGIPGVEKGKHSSATGFVHNPNFFGTYMLINFCYSLGLYIDKKKTSQIIYTLLIILFTAGLLVCNTTSAIVGGAFTILYLFIYCLKNKEIKKIITVTVIIICTTIIINMSGKTGVIKDTLLTAKEATEVATGKLEDNFGSGRMFIWKETMKIIPKYLLHGVGVDNFLFAFDGKALVSTNLNTVFDKAHNEYLQTLVTQGIFSLMSYLALYVLVLKRGVKNSFKNKETYLILPIIGYLVQAFFNISVIEVAPIFYIALGLAISKTDLNKNHP